MGKGNVLSKGLVSLVLASPLAFNSCTPFGQELSKSFALSAAQTYMQESIKKDVNPQQTTSNVYVNSGGGNTNNQNNNSSAQSQREPSYDISVYEFVDLNGDGVAGSDERMNRSMSEPVPEIKWVASFCVIGEAEYSLRDSSGKIVKRGLNVPEGRGILFGKEAPGNYTVFARRKSDGEILSRDVKFTGDFDKIRIRKYVDANNNGVREFGELLPRELNGALEEIEWFGLFTIQENADYFLKNESGSIVQHFLNIEKERGAVFGRVPAGDYTVVAKERSTGKEFTRKVRFTGNFEESCIRAWEVVDINGNGVAEQDEIKNQIHTSLAEVATHAFLTIDAAADYLLKDSSERIWRRADNVPKEQGTTFGGVPSGNYVVEALDRITGEKFTRPIRFHKGQQIPWYDIHAWLVKDKNGNGVADVGEVLPQEVESPIIEADGLVMFKTYTSAAYALANEKGEILSQLDVLRDSGLVVNTSLLPQGLYTVSTREKETGKEYSRKVKFVEEKK